MADLGSLSAALPTTVANGINNSGQVVGLAHTVARTLHFVAAILVVALALGA